ncbi:SGNH/GDSL hydrolase family protein [Planococcus glaciei]|uniref:SGNH/GDSL hydrolase family protein n=1 Tax=Planococcus glaciei TaxID=459472 RepID=UPI00069DA888|nr:SGNH/GDSL hydrolase family protein [Planococcus glaciei]
MRKFGAILLVIFCLAILVISYSSWKDKIGTAAEKPLETTKAAEAKQETDVPEKQVTSLTKKGLESLAAGMNEETRLILLDKFDNGERVQLLIVGSNATDSGEPGYAELLTKKLDQAYKGFIETTILSFNGTSEGFMNEETDLSVGYDIVLMEPFTLKNNGVVQIEAEREHVLEFLSQVRSSESSAALILHPPQPIYGAQFYIEQVKALEYFAAQQNFGYINHWPAWPATTDAALKDFLTDDGLPNTEGAEIWAQELSNYFITE